MTVGIRVLTTNASMVAWHALALDRLGIFWNTPMDGWMDPTFESEPVLCWLWSEFGSQGGCVVSFTYYIGSFSYWFIAMPNLFLPLPLLKIRREFRNCNIKFGLTDGCTWSDRHRQTQTGRQTDCSTLIFKISFFLFLSM